MIWVVGSKGMLGTELRRQLKASGLRFAATDREIDFLDSAALEAFANKCRPDWIVNCAAYTAVDKAEDEPGPCRRLNAEGPANLARLAEERGAALLHLSTDYVFDGSGDCPYLEDHPVAPTGVYGRTKAEGEAAVRELCSRSIILRTAWLYGRDGPNFVYTMLRLMLAKEVLGVVSDQRGSPTWTVDLARAILAVVGAGTPNFGTYHYTDGGETNWYEFALEIQRLGHEYQILKRHCTVVALTTEEYPTKARRPAYSVLSKEKILRDYGVSVPDWQESLAAFFASLGPAEAPRYL